MTHNLFCSVFLYGICNSSVLGDITDLKTKKSQSQLNSFCSICHSLSSLFIMRDFVYKTFIYCCQLIAL